MFWPPPPLLCTRHGLGPALPGTFAPPKKTRGAGRYPARGHLRLAIRGVGLSAGDGICATRGHPGCPPRTALPQPGGSAPSPLSPRRGSAAAPGPGLTQFSPAGSAQPLGLLLRLTAARAPRQPPAPPRYVTASRLPRRGEETGDTQHQRQQRRAGGVRAQPCSWSLQGSWGGPRGQNPHITMWGAGTLTGVSSSGVEMGEQSPFSLMPLPRSKSQIFTGETWGEAAGHGR